MRKYKSTLSPKIFSQPARCATKISGTILVPEPVILGSHIETIKQMEPARLIKYTQVSHHGCKVKLNRAMSHNGKLCGREVWLVRLRGEGVESRVRADVIIIRIIITGLSSDGGNKG